MVMLLIIRVICCKYNIKIQDTYAMMKVKKRVTLLWKPKYQSRDYYKKVFEALTDVVETYGRTFDEPGLLLHQLATNRFVAGADGDFLGADNLVQIAAAKATVPETMKVAIFLDGSNLEKYKNLKNDLENDFSKGTDNYPPTLERAVRLLKKYNCFLYTKQGVNLMPNEEVVAFIENGESEEVYPDAWKTMACFLYKNKGHTKEDLTKNKRYKKKKS